MSRMVNDLKRPRLAVTARSPDATLCSFMSPSRHMARVRDVVMRATTQERAAPPFKTHQRPDQQAAILLATKVLSHQLSDGIRTQKLVDTRVRIEDQAAHVIDALTAKPACIRGAEPLFGTADVLLRQQTAQHPPE